MVSKCIYMFTQSKSLSTSPNSLNCGLHVHLQIPSIILSKFICQCTRSRSSSASPILLHHRVQVHLQKESITASKFIFKEWREVYRDSVVMEVDCVMRSIYSTHPRVDRYDLMSISSCHSLRIHILSFRMLSLTGCVRDFMV